MKKTLKVTKISLASSQDNASDGQVFAICELQEDNGNISKLKAHSVIGVNAFSWLIDIGDYSGRGKEDKLESARRDLVGESDEFTTVVTSISELTQGKHLGFRIVGDDSYGVISTRRLVGYGTESDLINAEIGRLNRQALENKITWDDEQEGE